jgi:hypothetical protein
MDQQRITELCRHVTVFRQEAREKAARVPTTAWIVLGLFLLAASLMALRTAFVSRDAGLRLKVQHSLRSAQLSVWVDGELAYSGKLIGSMRKKFGFLSEIQGTLSETLPISSGSHQVRVRVASDDGSTQEDTISGDFARNSQRTLAVNARRDDVALSWQGQDAVLADSAVAGGNGWFGRYTSTLLMTIAGSIVSALTGFALRELPRHIASRQGDAPKA